MGQFFSVLPPENDSKREGVAWAKDIEDPLYHPRTAVEADQTHVFELRDIPYSDFLMSDIGWRLFSPFFREILDANKNTADGLRWCGANVINGAESREYFTYYFDCVADVLNPDDTIFAAGSVVRPSFRQSEADTSRVLTIDETEGIGRMYVTEHVVMAAREARLTGVMFSKARTK